MLPTTYNLDIYRGDTKRIPLTITDGDLTDVTVKAEIRDKPGGKLLAAFACNVTLPNAIELVLDAVTCAGLPSKGAWDLQLTYASGDVRTILYGSVKVAADVTDSVVAPVGLRAVS